MKGKFLFAAAFAALAVGCSQEELEAPVVADFDLSGRIGIQAPAMSLGNGVETRMTTDGSQAAVKWQENDGFGAMLVDQVKDLTSKEWGGRYTITPAVKHSNFLFRYNSTTGTFNTDAAMVEGNYVFYAPFNSAENTRKSLTIKTPTVQTITPDVLNSAVTKFYESGDPVFIAYKELSAESAETSIDITMKHIFATPLITLTNKYTTTDGWGNTVNHDLTVTKVVFTYSSNFMKTAQINHENVRSIFRTGNGYKDWEKNQHETAHTSDLYTSASSPASEICVNIEGDGLKVAPGQSKQFAVILPAENYGANLKATVYVKIDGKEEGKFFERVSTKGGKTLCLNPGFPYPAEEYNADGSLKNSKGTSATYELKATDLKDTPTVNPNEIKSEAELISYINNVAYRGQAISQVTADVDDPGKEFKIKDGYTITLTDAFFNAVKNSILVTTAFGAVNGSVEFTDISKIQLGAITQDRTVDNHVNYAAGELTVSGDYMVQNNDQIKVISGNVTVKKDVKKYQITNEGATINVEGTPGDNGIATINTITNNGGTVNIKGDILYGANKALTITNSTRIDAGGKTYYGTINISTGKTVQSLISNANGCTINNNGYLFSDNIKYAVTNSGLINISSATAGVKFGNGTPGRICNNVKSEYMYNVGTAEVYCELSAVPEDVLPSNINTVVLSGTITFDYNTFYKGAFKSIKTVEVKVNTTIKTNSIDFKTRQLSFKFENVNNNKPTWASITPLAPIKIKGSAVTKTGDVSFDNVDWAVVIP